MQKLIDSSAGQYTYYSVSQIENQNKEKGGMYKPRAVLIDLEPAI